MSCASCNALDCWYEPDPIVGNVVIVEMKSLAVVLPV